MRSRPIETNPAIGEHRRRLESVCLNQMANEKMSDGKWKIGFFVTCQNIGPALALIASDALPDSALES